MDNETLIIILVVFIYLSSWILAQGRYIRDLQKRIDTLEKNSKNAIKR